MIDHEVCKALGVLAASAQLGEPEREMLALHCLQCRSCRAHLSDLSFVGGQLLLHGAPSTFKLPQGSLDRFRACVVREGIPLRVASPSGWLSYGLAPALVTAMLFCAMLGMSLHRPHANRTHAVEPTAGEAPSQTGLLAFPAGLTAQLTAQPRHLRTVRRRALPLQNSAPAPAQMDLAGLRLRGTVSSSYLFVDKKPSSDTSLYPALSGTALRRLDLFRSSKGTTAGEPVAIATLDCPVERSATGCPFDFASNIRQLRFHIPATP